MHERKAGLTARTRPILVWDLPTRLFHWFLVALVAALWLTGEVGASAMSLHMTAGYAVLALLVFRLCWGVVGSATSRFAAFVYGPRSTLAYAASLRAGRDAPHPGHNPLGGWMIVALLAILLGISVSGLFATDDIMSEGPLSKLVSSKTAALLTNLHEDGFHVLVTLVALHVSAVLFYLVVKRDNLIKAMITGRKALPAEIAEPRIGSPVLAASVAALAALAVWGVVAGAKGF